MVAQIETWDGTERRRKDRRETNERRNEERTIFDRRSGLDRRGHPLYSPASDQEVVESEVE